MKNSEAKTKICPFITNCNTLFKCQCEDCMAWENIPKGRDVRDEDKEGFCKRLEK